jgi:two-component system, chemotaxis family, protein-glutamate methylesterase/glutaminase
MEHKLRVLVVDDTVTYRKIVNSVLSEMPDVEVVGMAANGKIALAKVEQLRPDLLLLDVEMPEVNGLEVLRRLQAAGSPAGAIVLSSLTAEGAQTTITCLELGAFDFVLKPSSGSIDENVQRLRGELKPRLTAFARRRAVRSILGDTAPPSSPRSTTIQRQPAPAAVRPVLPRIAATGKPQVVAIGISTGGPKALTEMLPKLPGDLRVPVLIVQHMPPVFTKSLADDLDRRCQLPTFEAEDGQEVRAGEILIAPGGRQMKIQRESDSVVVRITDDPPENSCRPSVDYLFRSVVATYGAGTAAVIMTGMGNDGSAGCRLVKGRGGHVVAQDEASCVVFGMPRQPVEEGIADVVAPLDRLASEIVHLVEKGRPACR